MPDTGYISGIHHYPALFEVSGIRPKSASLSSRIPDISKVQGNCVDFVKIKFTFSIYVKKFGASLKTLLLFRLSTNSKTESKPYTTLVIFYIKWIYI